jgi:isopentenyldiphosphate isomerase
MEVESLKIFDEQRNQIGIATREEVHKMGHWHETFHCWMISRENDIDYIFFQIRSDAKRDFPNLLDITAAGHILAHETIHDGIREVQEELGINVSFNELVSLGVIKDCIVQDHFIDKEICHVFLYQNNHSMDEYNLKKEEVSGIVKAEFNTFYELWLGEKAEITVEGFEIDDAGHKVSMKKTVNKNHFVPHYPAYYESIVKLIKMTL